MSVEYDYVDKQSIPTAGLSPASPTALWAAGHREAPLGSGRAQQVVPVADARVEDSFAEGTEPIDVLDGLNGCDRAGARDYAAFLGFFSLEPS